MGYIKPKKRIRRLNARLSQWENACKISKNAGKEYTKPGSLNK